MKNMLKLLALVTAFAVSTGTAAQPSLAGEADDQYAVAASHYAAQRWRLAVTEFETLLSKYPQHRRTADAVFFCGEAEMQLQHYDKAAASFGNLLEQHSDHRFARQTLFRLGESEHLSGSPKQAAEHLQAFLDTYPDDPFTGFALFYLAGARQALGDTASAESLYEQSVKHLAAGAKADEAQYHLGVLQYQRGDYLAAEKSFASFEVRNRSPRLKSQALYWRGLSLLGKQNWASAVKQFDALLAKSPEGPWADDCLLGKLQAAVGEDDTEAIEQRIAEFEQRFPGSALRNQVLTIQTRELSKQKDYDAIIQLLNAQLNDQSLSQQEILHSRYQLAVAYSARGRHAEALAEIEQVLASAQGTLRQQAFVAQAAVFLAHKKYSQAIAPLREYLALAPQGAEANKCAGHLTICYARSEKHQEAKRQYQKLEQSKPEPTLFLGVTLELAELALRRGDTEWGAMLFERLSQPENPSSYVARGLAGVAWCQCLGKDLDKSAHTFQQLLEKHPNDPLAADAALARGQLLDKMGRQQAALTTYMIVLNKYPMHASLPKALVRAAALSETLGQNSEAESLYQRLISECPKSKQIDEARYALGWLLHEREKLDEAHRQFALVHENHPDSKYWSDATYRLAEHALQLREYDEVRSLARKLIDSKPKTAMLVHALYLQGQAAVAEQKWAKVDEPLTKLLAAAPTGSLRLPAEYWLAEAAYRRQEDKLSQERFDALAEKIRGRDETWLAMVPLRRAQLLSRAKKWDEALEIVSTIRSDYPKFGQLYEADYLEGRALAAMARFAEARASYERVTSAETDQGGKTETAAMAQWMIGESYLHQQDYEQAIRAYLRLPALYAYPRWQAAALMQAGKCHEFQSEWGKAIELYERVGKDYPRTMFAGEVARRLGIARQRAARQPQKTTLQ